MDAALLDTDILSEVFKRRNAMVVAKASSYLQQHQLFTFSLFSRFEVSRGYLHKKATAQLTRFDAFCRQSIVLPLSEAILDRAAQLWGDAQTGGHPCGDADLLIAATALEHNLVLITGNLRHFTWIAGLAVEDWRIP
jgi:tRNA(fMet)-specific endonuclease VapC